MSFFLFHIFKSFFILGFVPNQHHQFQNPNEISTTQVYFIFVLICILLIKCFIIIAITFITMITFS
jgi:hypothetical protein